MLNNQVLLDLAIFSFILITLALDLVIQVILLGAYPSGVKSCIHNLTYRLTVACQKKCISPKYKEGDLTKGESVCLDRCVAKYLEIHDRIGKKLTAMSMQDEQLMSQLQGQAQGGN